MAALDRFHCNKGNQDWPPWDFKYYMYTIELSLYGFPVRVMC